jgi:flagellar biosynthesis chaperone FliJ
LVSKRNQLQEQRNSGPLSEQATKERQDLLDRLHTTIQQQHNTINSYKAHKAKGSSISLNVHRTALIELWNEKIPEGQTKPSSSTTRRWIKCIQNATSKLQDQLNDGSYNQEMNKLNYLKQKYEELIQSNIVSKQTNDETSNSNTSTIAMSRIDNEQSDTQMDQVDENSDARIVADNDTSADATNKMMTNHPMIVDDNTMVA